MHFWARLARGCLAVYGARVAAPYYVIVYRIAGLFRGRKYSRISRICVAVCENIICEYCITYKVWLKYENTSAKFLFVKYDNAIDSRKFLPRTIPAIR